MMQKIQFFSTLLNAFLSSIVSIPFDRLVVCIPFEGFTGSGLDENCAFDHAPSSKKTSLRVFDAGTASALFNETDFKLSVLLSGSDIIVPLKVEI
jgi:hypothetical protein